MQEQAEKLPNKAAQGGQLGVDTVGMRADHGR